MDIGHVQIGRIAPALSRQVGVDLRKEARHQSMSSIVAAHARLSLTGGLACLQTLKL